MGGSVFGLIWAVLLMFLRLLVLWPATLAGFVLVVALLVLVNNGMAEPLWQDVLASQATAYRDAPAGHVLREGGGCSADSPIPQSNDGLGTCPTYPVAVTFARAAHDDISFFTTLYAMLVVLSFIWMAFRTLSGQVLPVATEKGERSGSVNMRSARSRVIRSGDSIVVVTPEGEYHAMRVDKDGCRVATDGGGTPSGERDE
jgi:hypothetical protein